VTGALVIGIGNPDRGDDAAGLEVARRLRARGPQGVTVRESSGDASGLLEAFAGHSTVVLVDAASGGGRPGETRRLEAHTQPLPTSLFHSSTHSWGVAEAVELARTLGQLPPRVIVYAIEGRSFDSGRCLSAPVRKAVARVLEHVLREVEGVPR
jgi:hydrogenase maturation protease